MRRSPVDDALKPCQRPQKGRLAAAGRTDKRDEASLLDRQIDILERVEGAVVFVDAGQFDLKGHLRAPEVRPETIRRCRRTKMARIGVTYIVA